MFKDIYAISYKMKRELYHKILTVVVAVVLSFIGITLFMHFVLFPIRTVSDAMQPDVSAGSVALVTPLPFLRTPRRGDVMLVQTYPIEKKSLPVRFANLIGRFVTAQQWQPFADDVNGNVTTPFVRRVVALPGDTIYMENYLLYITPQGKQQPLSEFELRQTKYNITVATPPVGWDVEQGVAGTTAPITLGEGEYFVLSDNRLASADSRVWGVIPQEKFTGKVLLVYFPFSKFRVF